MTVRSDPLALREVLQPRAARTGTMPSRCAHAGEEQGGRMQALMWHGAGAVSLEDVPEPRPVAGEVVLRSLAAGVCGSEVEAYRGLSANRVPPIVMGHEVCGTVEAAAPDVEVPAVGRTVAVNPLLTCGSCPACRRGDRNRCPERRLIGLHTPGGFAERFCAPAANCLPVPPDLDPRAGAFVEPLANGVHAARLALGGTGAAEGPVLVLGAGAIGISVLQALRLTGAADVDVIEPAKSRREQASGFGARAAYASIEECREALGVDAAAAVATVDAVGTAQTRAAAVDLLARGGTAVLLGLHSDRTPLSFARVVREELTVLGSYAYSDEDFRRAVQWTAEGAAGPGHTDPVRPWGDGPAVFAELAESPGPQPRVFLGPAAAGSSG